MKKFIINFLPYLVVFIANIYRPIDPDLGWHLKYGEYFFKTGQVLRDNIFSTEMPDYKWANIAWGIDLINYAIFNLGGFFALSLAGAFVVTLTFFFFAKAYDLDYFEKAIIFPMLLFFLSPIHTNSFRGQLVSILLLSVLTYLLMKFERGSKKAVFFVPLVFLLWANLHGLFILGICIFLLWQGLYLVSLYLRSRSIRELIPFLKLFVPVTIVSIIAPLLHPFGVGVYSVAIEHFNSPLLRKIAEYNAVRELSMQWYNLLTVVILVGIGSIAFYVNKSASEKIPQAGIFTVLYILSLSVRKYLWAMYYFVIPFLKPIAGYFRPDTKKGIFEGATLLFVITLFFVFLIKYPFSQFTGYSWNEYCKLITCSPDGTEELRKYYVKGKTYTIYNWGGYMIWNFSDMKPSTDGRMSVWTDEKGYSGFEHDYRLEQNIDDVDSSKYDVVFTSRGKPIYRRFEKLVSSGRWKMVYRDGRAAIFVRSTPRSSVNIMQ